jgi:hypothetical protein
MTAGRDLSAAKKQLQILEATRSALTARLQRTLDALALTLDAENSTQLRIDAFTTHGRIDDHRRWESLQRQREAERYRALLGLLAAAGDDPADVVADA